MGVPAGFRNAPVVAYFGEYATSVLAACGCRAALCDRHAQAGSSIRPETQCSLPPTMTRTNTAHDLAESSPSPNDSSDSIHGDYGDVPETVIEVLVAAGPVGPTHPRSCSTTANASPTVN